MDIIEFKKLQKREKLLSALLVTICTMAPVLFTVLTQKKAHWVLCATTACVLGISAFWIQFYRSHISQKLKHRFESLDVGLILALKNAQARRYVITNTGYNHYHLKSLETGEQVLVNRRRAREDYNISL